MLQLNPQQVAVPAVTFNAWWKQFVAWSLNPVCEVFLSFAEAEQLRTLLNIWQSLGKVSYLIFKLWLENVPSQ